MKLIVILTALAVATTPTSGAAPDIDAAITRGVDFLIGHQNINGSWGGPTRTKGLNIYAPLPDAHQGYLIASSSIALQGLLECRDQRPATLDAIRKGEAWLLNILPKTRNITRRANYNIWGHAYGLRALASLYRHHRDPAQRAEYKRQALIQIHYLEHDEDINRGWGYYDFDGVTQKPSGTITSFTTGTVMLAMYDAAHTMGITLPQSLTNRAVRCLQEQRTPDFSYVYSRGFRYRPRSLINRPAGSLGRSQVCNAALRAFGDDAITNDVLRTWLQRLFDRNGWLDHGRKRPIPHEAPAQVAGYFYYYGHYYASECILMLPENERGAWKQKLATLLIPKQEKNGSWWDFPLYDYHYAYGTGYMLTILSRCQ